MYDLFHTDADVLKERYIYGAELTEEGFPILDRFIPENLSADLKPVPFNLISKEKNPKNAIAHFFLDDAKFSQIWNFPDKYFPILKNFRYVISTDFSAYDSMPLPLQKYQYFRDRAMAYYMTISGINVIPNCGFGGEKSWDFCFEGLPTESVLAITTNGRTNKEERPHFIAGFKEMEKRLRPVKIVCVGKPIEELETDIPIIYLDSFSQQWKKRMGK